MERCRDEGQRLLDAGEPLLAYDTLADGLKAFPGDVTLRQLLALALARSRASDAAVPILHDLLAQGHVDEETLGLLGSVYKDLPVHAGSSPERERHLQSALEYYSKAYELPGHGFWSGINAATTALLLGRRGQAEALARAVRDQVRSAQHADPSLAADYWHVATLAEAWLKRRLEGLEGGGRE